MLWKPGVRFRTPVEVATFHCVSLSTTLPSILICVLSSTCSANWTKVVGPPVTRNVELAGVDDGLVAGRIAEPGGNRGVALDARFAGEEVQLDRAAGVRIVHVEGAGEDALEEPGQDPGRERAAVDRDGPGSKGGVVVGADGTGIDRGAAGVGARADQRENSGSDLRDRTGARDGASIGHGEVLQIEEE